MDLMFDILKVILGAVLLLVGIGLRKAYKSTGMELSVSGDKYYAGAPRRAFLP